MRRGRVFYKDQVAGIITESDEGEYIFKYDSKYIEDNPEEFLTFSMPVREVEYRSGRLFPFFEGLIPEGWLLDIVTKNWKLDRRDKMGLLLACCRDCIGAVGVEALEGSSGDE